MLPPISCSFWTTAATCTGMLDLIAQFDSDTFTNQRVRLYELKEARPSDVQKDLEDVFKAISLDNKTSTVHFLPVDASTC